MGVKLNPLKAVLCLDIDGTLTDREGKIHPRDIAVLKNFPDNIQLIFSTGRSLASARGVLRENDIFPTGPFPLPGVFMNGGIALLPGERPVVEHFLTPDTLDGLLQISREFPNSPFTFFSVSEVFLLNPNAFSRFVSDRDYLSAQEVSEEDVPRHIVKAMVIEEDPSVITEIKERGQHLAVEMGISLPYLFEINPPGVNKAGTLKQLLPLMGLDELKIYAAGDGENDLALLEMTEKFYVPDTAHDHVRDQADQIIDRRQEGMLAPILSEIS